MVHRVLEVDVAVGVLVAEQLIDDPVAVLELCLLLLLEQLLARLGGSSARDFLLLVCVLLVIRHSGTSSVLRGVVDGQLLQLMLAEMPFGALRKLVQVLLRNGAAQSTISGAAVTGPTAVADALELEAITASGKALRADDRARDRRSGRD